MSSEGSFEQADADAQLSIEGLVVEKTEFTAFVGPLPSPKSLKGYEMTVSGAADRIITMAELEQKHRHGLEKSSVEIQGEDARRDRREAFIGQICGLTIGLCAIVTGGVIAVNGAQWPGGFIGTAGVTGLVTTFVTGRTGQGPKQ